MIVPGGSTDITTFFSMRLAATGLEATGLTISDFDMQYTRTRETPTAKVDAVALAATNTAHTDNRGIEIDATDQPGLYRFDWPDAAFAAGAKEVILSIKHASCITEHLRVEIDPVVNANITQLLGSAIATPTVAGVLEVDLTHANGTAITTTTAGVPAVDVTRVQNVTAAATNLSRYFTAGSTSPLTADSGTTTTLTDSALTAADADYYKGCLIVFGSGTLYGQTRLITGFDPGTDTLTFYPATTQAVSTHTYQIIPAGMVDLWGLLGSVLATPSVAGVPEVDITHWLGTAVAAVVAGRPLVDVGLVNSSQTAARAMERFFRACKFGTADSGTTTTIVDTDLNEAETTAFEGYMAVISTGTNYGQARRVVDFDPATDTLTVDRAFPAAIDNTSEYVLIPPRVAEVSRWNSTAVTGDGDWNELQTDVDAILLDTNELQTDWADGGRLDLLIDAILEDTGTILPSALSTILAHIDTEVAAILADTSELQTDLTDGGRLDLILDAINAKTTNLPSDPADASVINARFDLIDTALASISIDPASLFDHEVESGITFEEAIKVMAAILAGDVSGAGTSNESFAAIGNAGTPRVTSHPTVQGDRTVDLSL